MTQETSISSHRSESISQDPPKIGGRWAAPGDVALQDLQVRIKAFDGELHLFDDILSSSATSTAWGPQQHDHITGWWLWKNPSEKYEFVTWDDELPKSSQYFWKNTSHVPNHQPVSVIERVSVKPSERW